MIYEVRFRIGDGAGMLAALVTATVAASKYSSNQRTFPHERSEQCHPS